MGYDPKMTEVELDEWAQDIPDNPSLSIICIIPVTLIIIAIVLILAFMWRSYVP